MNAFVYPFSRKSAEHDGNLDIWCESHTENIACAKSIKDEIAREHNGTSLGADSANRIITRFGYDRVNWVLATSIQQMSGAEGISQDNREWATQYDTTYLKKEIDRKSTRLNSSH